MADPLDPALLLAAYRQGAFPMAPDSTSDAIDWYLPQARGVLPLDAFHVPKNLARHLRQTPYTVTVNADFGGVIRACAARDETWISPRIIASYEQLHALGHAHSLELYHDGELVGGQYGVAIGAAFFGESMFHHRPMADQASLYFTHQRLVARGYRLWDCQFWTPHLGRFGAVEISQTDYLARLADALAHEGSFA